MEDKTYRITLADGTEIAGLRLNGNNYISATSITAEMFDGNCAPVVINDGENDEIHENMELVQITHMTDGYWFILRDLTETELEQLRIRADIEYIAMMAGVDL